MQTRALTGHALPQYFFRLTPGSRAEDCPKPRLSKTRVLDRSWTGGRVNTLVWSLAVMIEVDAHE